MRLPDPTTEYDAGRERERNRVLEGADRDNRKKGQDVELGEDERVILRSPDGTRWALTVDNTGAVSAVAA